MVEISARRRAVKTVDELIVDLNSAGFDLSVSAYVAAPIVALGCWIVRFSSQSCFISFAILRGGSRTEAIRLYGRVGQMAKVKALIPPTPAVPVLNAGLRALVYATCY